MRVHASGFRDVDAFHYRAAPVGGIHFDQLRQEVVGCLARTLVSKAHVEFKEICVPFHVNLDIAIAPPNRSRATEEGFGRSNRVLEAIDGLRLGNLTARTHRAEKKRFSSHSLGVALGTGL